MIENAYQAPAADPAGRRTRGAWWAIGSGIFCLAGAAICAVLTVVRMIFSFRAVSESAVTPKADELAEGISNALIPAYAGVPFGLLGIVLIIIGFVMRRPIDR